MTNTFDQTARRVGVAEDGSLVTLINEKGAGWVVTAQHLLEGDAIYLSGAPTEQTGWTRNVAEARFFTDKADAEAAVNVAATRPDMLIGPYVFDAIEDAAGVRPASYREAIRAQGPTFGPRFEEHLQKHAQRSAG